MAEFHFLRPYWFLAVIPCAYILWHLWHRQYYSRGWQSICDPHLLPFLLVGTSGQQQKWPIMLAGVLSSFVIMALAGPTWNKLEQPVFREQSSLVVILDLSRSMDATDITPSRLTRARHKLIDILRQRKEGQTALIVYAGDAYTVSPLTDDSQTMLAMVKTLTTDLMPIQGSAVDKALRRAMELLQQAGARQGQILLITDGINNSQLKKSRTLLKSTTHSLSVLGIGTSTGAPIRLASGGFLIDEKGAIVIPKLDEQALRQLATSAGGRYQALSADDSDLNTLLASMRPKRMNTEREETSFNTDRWHEEGPWLLLIVLPFAALAFRRGYLLVLFVLVLPTLPQPAIALEWDELWQRPEQKAAKQLQKTDPSATLPRADIFSDPEWKAASHYRASEYQQAVESLQGLDKADALYNKGNALAKLGKYSEALQAYDQVLKKQPNHEDAKFNRQQVEKMMQKQSSDQSNQDSEKKQPSDEQHNKDNKQQENSGNQSADQKSAKDNPDNKQQKSQHDKQNKGKENEKNEQQDKQQAQNNKEQGKDKSKDEAQQNSTTLTESREEKEKQQATEQWLRRIPDDPGGLLRRKFQYEHQRKRAEGKINDKQNGKQAW